MTLAGALRDILAAELAAGNTVREDWRGDWPESGCRFVLLEKPFMTKIRRDIPGVVFRDVNDPHYWKAEYHDESEREHLACGFGGAPNFSELA
jgi:hypothetical protein